MKPSRDSDLTTGDGAILVAIRSKGAEITPEARERARKRAETGRNGVAPARPDSPAGNSEPNKQPDGTN